MECFSDVRPTFRLFLKLRARHRCEECLRFGLFLSLRARSRCEVFVRLRDNPIFGEFLRLRAML